MESIATVPLPSGGKEDAARTAVILPRRFLEIAARTITDFRNRQNRRSINPAEEGR